MSKVGSLNDIQFLATSEVIQTLRDASLSGTAGISTHSRHLAAGILEYTGNEPDTFTFSLRSSAFIGASPTEVLSRLNEYKENGTILTLMLGTERIGRYRWLLSKFKASINDYDAAGNPADIDFSITLIEYVKE